MQRAKRTDFEVDERRETGRVGGGEERGVSRAELQHRQVSTASDEEVEREKLTKWEKKKCRGLI